MDIYKVRFRGFGFTDVKVGDARRVNNDIGPDFHEGGLDLFGQGDIGIRPSQRINLVPP
jgi:hypothetical protein